MMTKHIFGTALALCLTATGAFAQDWKLSTENSRLAFGSVKNSYNGEVHTFEGLTGMVSADGAVKIDIPLGGVSTNIEIRNERFGEFLFKNAPTATLSAALDMDALSAMKPGETTTLPLEADLSFLGNDIFVETEVFVARMSADSVLVTTNDMLFIDTEELGIDTGIDKLQELASLDSITRTTPITVRFVFTQ